MEVDLDNEEEEDWTSPLKGSVDTCNKPSTSTWTSHSSAGLLNLT